MFITLNATTWDVRLSAGLRDALGIPAAVTIHRAADGVLYVRAARPDDAAALPVRGGLVHLGGARVRALGLTVGRNPAAVDPRANAA